MGWLIWLFMLSIVGSISATLVIAVLGDKLLTWALRKYAAAYVGDKFAIKWSVRDGLFELRALVLGQPVLKMVGPMLGMPMEVEKIALEQFTLVMPLVDRFLTRGTTPKVMPMQSRVEIVGFQLALSVDDPMKWVWMKEENLARYEQAIKDAATARIARVNAWTNVVVQKLKDLANRRKTKEDALAKSTTTATTTTTTTRPPNWQVLVDEVVDSFAIVVHRVAITIRDDHSATGVGMTMEEFALERAHVIQDDKDGAVVVALRKREMRVVEFALFVNATAHSPRACYLIKPMNIAIGVRMPAIVQSLVMQCGEKTRVLGLEIALPDPVVLQVRPAQLTKLLALLRPISFHGEWYQRALVADEASCVELTVDEKTEYQRLFREQWTLDNETGLIGRKIAAYRQKETIQQRQERLSVLESKTLATQLLCLRAKALNWEVPSGGTPLPHMNEDRKLRKDLRSFLDRSLDTYEKPMPAPPMFHSCELMLHLACAEIQLLENTDSQVLTLFAHNTSIELTQALDTVDDTANATVVDLKVMRFGILDERNVATNVYRRLIDRNPDAAEMLDIQFSLQGSGHMDVKLAVQNFSILVIFDPLLYTAKTFVAALEEDEETQMKYLAYTALSVPQSPEVKEDDVPIYTDQIPQEYSPLVLQGMSLCAQIAMRGVEICLLGDSRSLKSHVLAFTSDTTVKVVSSKQHEAVEIELVDVALQPCTVVTINEGIDLEIPGLRTILELEGEGVDLMLGYKLVVGEPKHVIKSDVGGLPQSNRSTSQLWNVVRKGLTNKQIAEVEHPELRRAEEEALPPTSNTARAQRIKAGARRKLVMTMSDFAMNLSANDLGVLLSIVNSLNEAMKEEGPAIQQRQERADRLARARKDLEEARYMERLKAEFRLRDTDGGGSLDTDEVTLLIKNVVNCDNLTKDEFEATVREFIGIVDRDGSGDISLEEFEAVLSRKKIVYHQLHHSVVGLTGQEYVDPTYVRSTVPYLVGPNANSVANMAGLLKFWERYEDQVGATRTSLNGLSAIVVQKKMVRTFKNYEYAQEAWNRLVNPSLVKPAEQSIWLLSKEMDMGRRGNVIDQLLSSFEDLDSARTRQAAGPTKPELRMFIHTVISTSFGGFYMRLIDETLPMGSPSLEVSCEELAVYANFSMWEGEIPDSTADVRVRKCTSNNFGIAKVSFSIYGRYYNTKARQVEPFLEFYQGTLDVHKEPESFVSIAYTSDRYFQLNVTFAFMEVVKSNLASFANAEQLSEKVRPHIKEEDGLFWMLNETGVNVKYYVVAKKVKKDHVRVESVTPVTSVPNKEAHPCRLLNVDEEMKDYEQQSLKEKQLRQAFRNADADKSGELDTHEVRAVLREVYEEEAKHRRLSSRDSTQLRKSGSMSIDEAELDTIVNDFIALADTDGSGQVSWEEFKAAISKTREVVDRFISLEVEGYHTIHNIPLASFGHTQVYELTPYFEDVATETSPAALYEEGLRLTNLSDQPSRQDLDRAYACLHRANELDSTYEWVDSALPYLLREYTPALIAVHISVDGVQGLQVKVTGAEYIRNDTIKATECLLVNDKYQVSPHNPIQAASKERFFVLPAKGSISIPLDLVDVGYFAIRQMGETEWSNYLPLSVRDQQMYTKLTRLEQREAIKAQRGGQRSSIGAAKLVTEKLGKNVALPTQTEYVPPGKEIPFPSARVIDNQPTIVIKKTSINDMHLGTWSLVIQPQLALQNVLPCGLEYMIVQPQDCPSDMLDSNGDFRSVNGSNSGKSSRGVKMLGQLDYFQYVSEVNCRRLYVESGKSIQVFGLDLNAPALMKVRLCASASQRASTWSAAFNINLHAPREVFNAETFEVRFGEGPCAVFQQQWLPRAARNIIVYAPYWIQNRSGLDFQFRMPKGSLCNLEQHRSYFNGAKDIPILVNAPATKAMISVKPYQATPRQHANDFFASPQTKKYLPSFDRVDWSEPQDMSSVGTKGEMRPSGSGNYSFVIAYEVLAAPSQFVRTKILRLTPRFVVVSRVPRPLQITPVMLDKKYRGLRASNEDVSLNVSLKEGDAVAVFRFAGNEKSHNGLRLRDLFRDESLKDLGPWSANIPVVPGDDFNVWTRGSLGDGPTCNIAFQNIEETIYATICDTSTSPRYRIENRSTRYAFRYIQLGLKDAEEIVINPLESHSFVWDNPLVEAKKLKVTPVNWKIPTEIDFMTIGTCQQLTASGMYSEVYVDGSTRVFAVGDTPIYFAERQQLALNDWMTNTLIDVAQHGFGLTIVDGRPVEVLNLTMEGLRLVSKVGTRACEFSLHHMQIDDMTPHALYPVILAPLDTGYNSDKREGWLPQDGETPFFALTLETSPQVGLTVVNDFNIELGSLSVKLNLEYLLGLGNLLMEFIPTSDEDVVIQQGVDYKNLLLSIELNVPEQASHGGTLMYFKRWRLSDFDFHLVFDSAAEENGEGISQFLGNTVGSIVGGIAHVTPEFHFKEIAYGNRFFYEYDLVYTVVLDIVFSVLGQWYKIVGSVELLGDPVGLATDIVDGFALAARQLKRDVKGRSLRKGESALTLVQTIVGAPMKSIGKVSNGLGDVVKKAVDFQSQEDVDQPRHVPEGLLQSGVVFTKSIAYGVKGFVKEPVRGAKKDGVKGFAKGVGRGTLQLVASPFVGTLGVVEKLSHSVNNTTHLLDEKSFDGTRRPARDLVVNPLKPLSDSNVITEVEVHALYVENLPVNSNPQVVVRVYQQSNGNPARDLGKYKSSTLHHTTTPKFDQSWLIGITSLDTFIEVRVYHKRKPLPKKLLGYLRFSMEDIYRDFTGVPAKILADTKAKLRLKKRKRHSGSIFNDLAQSTSQELETRDEMWRQKISHPDMASFMSDDFEDENDENDDYESDVMLLSSRSITVPDNTLPVQPVGLPLQDSETGAKMFLSIRYVNDMRRYA